jgi:peptidylprolyl isomerase
MADSDAEDDDEDDDDEDGDDSDSGDDTTDRAGASSGPSSGRRGNSTSAAAPQRSAKNPHVYIDLQAGNVALGRVVIELFTDVPLASENFRALCTGAYRHPETGRPLSYENSQFNMVREDYMVGGDVDDINGEGKMSIYGAPFEDEPAGLARTHTIGSVSLFSKRKDSNDSKFVICLKRQMTFMDGQYVVCGQVIKGLGAAFAATEYVSDHDAGTPDVPIFISGCGRLRKGGKKDKKAAATAAATAASDAAAGIAEEIAAELEAEAAAAKTAKAAAAARSDVSASVAAAVGTKAACPKCSSSAWYVRRVPGSGLRFKCKNKECGEGFYVSDTPEATAAAEAALAAAEAAKAKRVEAQNKKQTDEAAARERRQRAQDEWQRAKELHKAAAGAAGISLDEYMKRRRAEKAERKIKYGDDVREAARAEAAKKEREDKAAAKAAKRSAAAAGGDAGAVDAAALSAARRKKVAEKLTAKGLAHTIAGEHIKLAAKAAGEAAAAAKAVKASKDKVKSDRRVEKKKQKRVQDKLKARREARGGAGSDDDDDDDGGHDDGREAADEEGSEERVRLAAPRAPREHRGDREHRPRDRERSSSSSGVARPAGDSEEARARFGRDESGKKIRHRDIGAEGVERLRAYKAEAQAADGHAAARRAFNERRGITSNNDGDKRPRRAPGGAKPRWGEKERSERGALRENKSVADAEVAKRLQSVAAPNDLDWRKKVAALRSQ